MYWWKERRTMQTLQSTTYVEVINRFVLLICHVDLKHKGNFILTFDTRKFHAFEC